MIQPERLKDSRRSPDLRNQQSNPPHPGRGARKSHTFGVINPTSERFHIRPISATPAGVAAATASGSGGRPLLPQPTAGYSLATLRVGTAWPMSGCVQSVGLADSSRKSKGAQGAATSGNDCVGGMHPEGRARSSDALATIAASSPDADISGTPAGVRGSFVLGSGGRPLLPPPTTGNDCVGGMHPEGRARSSDALATIAASSPDAPVSGTPAGVRGSFVLGSGGRRGLRGWRPPEANRHNAPRMGCQKTQCIITYGQHILQPSLPHRL